jgi:hypothetical protein
VRLVYYVVRVVVTPTYRSMSAVGCRFDLSEGIMFLVLPACFLGVLGPVFLRLLNRPDALGLRNELFLQVSDQETRTLCSSVLVGEFVVVIDVLRLLQIVVFPPFMLWWFVYILKDYDASDENGVWVCLVVC